MLVEYLSGFGQRFWSYNLKREISTYVFIPTVQISRSPISAVIPNAFDLDTCCRPHSVVFYSHSNFCNEGLKELKEALFMKTFMFYMITEH